MSVGGEPEEGVPRPRTRLVLGLESLAVTVFLVRLPGGRLDAQNGRRGPLATSAPGVYAGGDVAFGPRNLIEAVANGKRAARSDSYSSSESSSSTSSASSTTSSLDASPSPGSAGGRFV